MCIEITRSYIQQEHTLILGIACAIDKMRSSKALAIIKELKKEDKALTVFTMCDHAVGTDRLREEFLQQMKGTTPDSITMKNGYFAVKNRDTKDKVHKSLKEAAAEERAWFSEVTTS